MVKGVKIREMKLLVSPYPVFVGKEATADEVAKAMIANPSLKSICIVDDEGRLTGQITLRTLIKEEFVDLIPNGFEYFDALRFAGEKLAKNLMSPAVYVKNDDTLKTAFVMMLQNNLDSLPVVDEDMRLIGNIDMLELLTVLVEKKEQEKGKKYLVLTTNRPFFKRFG